MNKKLADSRFSLSARFTMLAVFLIASMILSVRFGSTNVPLSDILSEVSAFISTGRPAETASSMIFVADSHSPHHFSPPFAAWDCPFADSYSRR